MNLRVMKIPDKLQTIAPVFQKYSWAIMTAWMLVIFFWGNFVLVGVLPVNIDLYLVQPVLWLSIAALVVFLKLCDGEPLTFIGQRDVILAGLMLGGIQVAVGLLAGLVLGFGNSPYAREILYVILNLWFVGARLVGIEAGRWYLATKASRQSQGLGLVLAWLMPLVLIIPIGKYSLITQPDTAFRLVGQTLLPSAAESLLSVTLVITGGPLASIAYRGIMQAFEWLSPILPDLPWLAAAFIGVLVPVLGLIAVNNQGSSPLEAGEKEKIKNSDRAPLTSWLLVGVLAVGIIWFNSGVFGVQPSLISGNSMNPTYYPGDIVVVQNIKPEDLTVGDVVRFHRDGIDVVHRIKTINQENNELVFTTRGDNNNVDDAPVSSTNIEGKVILAVPKIGWISIFFRQAFAWIGG